MKKRYQFGFILTLLLLLIGCGQNKNESLESNDELSSGTEIEQEDEENNEVKQDNGELEIDGMISEQSFDVDLDEWGDTYFVSAEPSNLGEEPTFYLTSGKDILYSFPKKALDSDSEFVQILAVSFQDITKDEKKDIVVVVQYKKDNETYNRPIVFIQNNSDSMFYLDYPDLEEYKIGDKTQDEEGFYRDTFYEDYLTDMGYVNTVSDITESYVSYIDYIEAQLYGTYSVDSQIDIFAEQKDTWAKDLDYADDIYRFSIADLNSDGLIELIVSNFGGTGMYTYNRFYNIDDNGEVKEISTSFEEGESQPDLMSYNDVSVYEKFNVSGIETYFLFTDQMKISITDYLTQKGTLNLSDGSISYKVLTSKETTYSGEDSKEIIQNLDFEGNQLTEESYELFADDYFTEKGFQKETAHFEWGEVSDILDASKDQAVEIIKNIYAGFYIK